jgi:hypothetical protein
MGDLNVDDKIIGANGKPVTVIGIYPQGEKDIYRVTFSDGAQTECCDEHLWTVNTPLRKDRNKPPVVKSLQEMRKNLVDAAGNSKWFIPIVQPVEFEEGNLPLDPYLIILL